MSSLHSAPSRSHLNADKIAMADALLREAFEKWADPFYYDCKICRDHKPRKHDNLQTHLRKVHSTGVKEHLEEYNVKRLMHKCRMCNNLYIHCKRHLVNHFAASHGETNLYDYFVVHIYQDLERGEDPADAD